MEERLNKYKEHENVLFLMPFSLKSDREYAYNSSVLIHIARRSQISLKFRQKKSKNFKKLLKKC